MRTSYYAPDGQCVGIGEITSLPGCSQIGVFHSAFVLPQFRNNGYGTKAHAARLRAAKDALYDAAICTVQADNKFQIEILEANGWVYVWDFVSKKTGHIVHVYMRSL